MLNNGLYRDKHGRTAYVQTTPTGYVISYTDGPTITLPRPDLSKPAHEQPPAASDRN